MGFSIKPNRLLSSIGMIVAQFVSLEYSIMETICILMPSVDSKFTYRLLADDKFSVLLNKFKRVFLYQVKSKNFKKEFDSICTELKKINEQRNDFIHAIFADINEKEIIRLKLKPDIHIAPSVFETKSVTQEEIDEFIERIMNAKESLSDFNKKIIKLLPKEKSPNVLATLKNIHNEKEKNGNQEKENNQKQTRKTSQTRYEF